jgi:hypothetical protein
VEWASSPLDNRISNETAIVARTPLLQFLKALSSDVRRCQGRDISVSELLAERLAAPSRRQFVAGAAVMATSAALPEVAFAAPSKTRIAIVGAGIAGLNAALTLQDSGIGSTVYEASNRIGGRMFSATSIWADNQVSEWCGELIDSDHGTIIGLARRFGLPLDDFAGNPSLQAFRPLLHSRAGLRGLAERRPAGSGEGSRGRGRIDDLYPRS